MWKQQQYLTQIKVLESPLVEKCNDVWQIIQKPTTKVFLINLTIGPAGPLGPTTYRNKQINIIFQL